MYGTEDDVMIAPWVGPTSCQNVLSIAILSLNEHIIQRISEALIETHSKGSYRWKVRVLRCFRLEELVKMTRLTGRIALDFVVLGIDTGRVMCLDWTQKVLKEISPDLRSRRVILVNASGLPPDQMAVSSEQLLHLVNETKLDLLNADVFKHEDAMFLAQRLIKYMEVTIGVNTSFPNINI